MIIKVLADTQEVKGSTLIKLWMNWMIWFDRFEWNLVFDNWWVFCSWVKSVKIGLTDIADKWPETMTVILVGDIVQLRSDMNKVFFTKSQKKKMEQQAFCLLTIW